MSPNQRMPALLPRIAAAALALSLTASLPAAAAAKDYTVIVENLKFGPLPANLKVGDTIIWTNKDFVEHTATARDGTFNVDLPPKSKTPMVVRKEGRFAFYCIYHPTMTGTLNVQK